MTHRANLFKNGGSRAVGLPIECRFPDEQHEDVVRRVGRGGLLEPPDAWSPGFYACVRMLEGENPRPKLERLSDLRDPLA